MLAILFLANIAMLMGMTNWPQRTREGFACKMAKEGMDNISPHTGLQWSSESLVQGAQFARSGTAKKEGFMNYLSNGFATAPIGSYDGTNMAANLPPDGRLIAFDVDGETAAVAQAAWQRAALSERIELRLEDAGPGLAHLATESGIAGQVDLAFIDGPNEAYAAHAEALLPLLRPGGLLVFDNTLWKGEVLRAASDDPRAQALRRLNRQLRDDPRLHSCTLSLGDGLSLAMKR